MRGRVSLGRVGRATLGIAAVAWAGTSAGQPSAGQSSAPSASPAASIEASSAAPPAASATSAGSAPPASASAAPSSATAIELGVRRLGAPPPRAPTKAAPRTDLAAGEKRPTQDYDGREDVTTTAEDALWIPRVVLFPVYLVTEYLVRQPLGALTVWVEQNNVVKTLQSAFLFGPDNNIGVIPTAFVDFGLRPSVGLYFLYNDFIAPGNDLRASVGFGGVKFWKASLADRIPIDTPIGKERSRSYLQLEGDFLTRADLSYWGLGPNTRSDDQSGYSIFTYGGGARVHVEPWRGKIFEAWGTARYVTTGVGECDSEVSVVDERAITHVCDPPTIRRRILDGDTPPPGYGRPYTTVKSGLRVVIDSRDPRPAPGTGVALDASGEHVVELKEPRLGSWINYGATLGGFVDLTGTQRVLGLTVQARFQDPVGGEGVLIPFTERVGAKHIEDVPDLDLMRGFLAGRLLGSSAVAATLEYRWPIWAFLDGTLQTAVGNAFAERHLEDFDPERLRFSFVGGIRSPNHRDHSFNLLAGFGTDTFRDGGAPSSFRFVFGGTTGF